jgi:5'(3')-deoxyribonucleotidase
MKPDREPVVLLDMDGTVADYIGKMEYDMEQLRGPNEPVFKMSHDIEYPAYLWNRVELIKNSKDWWLNLPSLQDGFNVMYLAQQIGFEIHVLTKGPKNTKTAWTQKVEWCAKHLPEGTNVTITQDKGIVYGRILVDDYPGYMDAWLRNRPRSLGIMPLRDYNKDYSHPNVIHYDINDPEGLDRLRERMQEHFDR